tara:strand:+ start:204 stop:389 length:186 start_codon:yes stop_codon:yes gene_type:complete
VVAVVELFIKEIMVWVDQVVEEMEEDNPLPEYILVVLGVLILEAVVEVNLLVLQVMQVDQV